MTAISQAIELSGLTKDKSEILTSKFGSMIEQIEEWKQKASGLTITDASQKEEIEIAKSGYKFIKGVRIDIEKTRKALKEDSLKEGKAIDLIAKNLTEQVSPLESELEEKARFVEIQAERCKAKQTQERLERLASLNFAVPQNATIADMSVEIFDTYFNGLIFQAEKVEAERREKEEAEIMAEMNAKVAREAAEKIEKERIENQRIENEKLKIEAEKREAEIAEERNKVEAERIKQEEIQTRIQAEKDEEIRLEKEKSEKLEAEIRNKAYQEESEKALKAAKEREDLNAPDKEKLLSYVKQVGLLKVSGLQTIEAKELYSKRLEEINKVLDKALIDIDKL